jgi:ATP-binding cassette, subfamily B, bacterial CvaB/MchF/RaxB
MLQDLLNFSGRRRLPVYLQTEAAECGLACLAMIASFHRYRVDLNTLRRRFPVSLKGVTLKALMQIAEQLQLSCRPLKFDLDNLHQLRLPAVVHWDMNHFVVLKEITRKGIVVHDPAVGEKFFSMAEASRHLTGVAVEITPTDAFNRDNKSKEETERLPLSAFWSHTQGIGHALLQILALSVVMELFVIASPYYMQLAVDEVIARGDVNLLTTLAFGFALLTLIGTTSSALRNIILLFVQNTLHFQMGARLFHHLIRLPLVYFEKRHIGDILSRFSSIEPIRDLLSQGLIAALIDGIMALVTLVMIFFYSATLAMVVLAALALYILLRVALFRTFWLRSQALIQTHAKENSTFIETVRAMQSLKLFNRENERETQWLNRYADSVNANIRIGRTKVAFKTANDAIFGVEGILTVYLAAQLALANELTVGMIFAFMAYKHQFTDKAVLLVEKALELRILGLHLERLSDIALNPLEQGHDRPLDDLRRIQGKIELRNVCFRYAESEPYVLENVNLTIQAGQFVTIMGPSGGGKTTLIKIMLGLLEPTSGEVLIDGIPLSTIGPRALREHVGAVMQDDQLLSGTIADNICFFDPHFDQKRMVECAHTAGMHDEIMAMPMAYSSLIGDMGSSLSGGQKQRVLLARALYRAPKVLVLDEGTAHLDIEKERQINERLRALDITRVSVAHRAEFAGGADAVLRIGHVHEAVS